ncbi:MAG: 4-hydroxybenzoate octaprenyltransferase, partial [Alphaproteobacteria bacterium]|nr:4-hydroxybenzoate octaprenyltransferase [Alphaproteobacteria bacterium]
MTETPSTPDRRGTDMPAIGWVDRLLPAWAVPYAQLMRLDRPIGTWLLLFPGLWSIALALNGPQDLRYFAYFAAGALIMRGAGCVWNDITDRDFDRQVARTRTRPLASGAVSLTQALGFLVLLLFLGLLILLQFNLFAAALGAASLLVVAVYPLMKRITHWPQFVLGLAFNWGALLGWAALEGALAAPALALYAGGILWTLGYDTIYAHQDKEDDALIGVKSTALLFGTRTKTWLWGFYGGAIVMFAVAGALADLRWPYFLLLAVGAAQLAWQVQGANLD